MRWVILDRPHLGGTTQYIRRLRRACGALDIDIVTVGFERPDESSVSPSLAAACGYMPIACGGRPRDKREALIACLGKLGADGVIINMLSSNEAMNMLRFLPVEYARIGVVHGNSVATINAAVALAPYLDEIVAPSVRVAQMVQRRLRAEKSITVIPHAVDREFFQVPVSPFGRKEATIAYIGRLSHLDKGVLDLPKIVRYVKAKPLKLKIVGAGPDEQALRARLSAVDADVEWQGPVSWEELPDILREIDVVVVPSRLEGFCFVAAEAMAAGRTVVMSRIKGVADQLIRHGENGFLFDVGDLRAAARWIDESVADRSRLAAIGEAAKFAMRSLCSMETFAEAYREVMVRAKMRRPEKRLVEPLESWDLPKGLRPGIRAYLPEAVKRYARLWRERLAR